MFDDTDSERDFKPKTLINLDPPYNMSGLRTMLVYSSLGSEAQCVLLELLGDDVDFVGEYNDLLLVNFQSPGAAWRFWCRRSDFFRPVAWSLQQGRGAIASLRHGRQARPPIVVLGKASLHFYDIPSGGHIYRVHSPLPWPLVVPKARRLTTLVIRGVRESLSRDDVVCAMRRLGLLARVDFLHLVGRDLLVNFRRDEDALRVLCSEPYGLQLQLAPEQGLDVQVRRVLLERPEVRPEVRPGREGPVLVVKGRCYDVSPLKFRCARPAALKGSWRPWASGAS